eukprot:s3983_g6.t1
MSHMPIGEVGKLIEILMDFPITSLLNHMLGTETEGEETETTSPIVVADNIVVEQVGGGKRANNAESSAQQKAAGTVFKMVSGYSSRVQRIRYSAEDTRLGNNQVEHSSVKCSTIQSILSRMDAMIVEADTNPEMCLFHLFEHIPFDRILKFVSEVASHNNMPYRIKQVRDLCLPMLDVELDEVLTLIDTTRRVVKRSLENILVMFYANDMGNIEWTQFSEAMLNFKETYAKVMKKKMTRSTGTRSEHDGDDDSDDNMDVDDDKPKKKAFVKDWFILRDDDDKKNAPENDEEELFPDLENLEIKSNASKRGRGRPPSKKKPDDDEPADKAS